MTRTQLFHTSFTAPIHLAIFLMATVYPAVAWSEIHPKVQAALDWQLPVNECKKPRKLLGYNPEALEDGKYATRSATSPPAGTTNDVQALYDIDHYKIARYERQQKRWNSCLNKYKDGLSESFEELKNSAQYGLTKAQANTILAKLALIQETIMSPDGVADQSTQPTEGD